jgi:hypothetical protein
MFDRLTFKPVQQGNLYLPAYPKIPPYDVYSFLVSEDAVLKAIDEHGYEISQCPICALLGICA